VLKRYYQVFGSLLIVSDVFGLIGTWLLAYYLRFYTQIVPVTKGIPPFSRYVALTVPVVFLWLGVFSYFRLYRTSKVTRRTTELANVLKAHGTALALFLVLSWVVTEYRFSRVVIGYFGALSGLYFLSTRLALRNILRRIMANGKHLRSVLVVGAGSSAQAIVSRTQRMPELGIKVVGFLTKDGSSNANLRFPVLGKYENVNSLCEKYSVQEIILALPREDSPDQEKILKNLDDSILDVHLVPDVYDYVVLGCAVEDFDQMPVLALNESPIDPLASFIKRVVDIGVSFSVLVLFFPIYFFLAILVKITSSGPIFYGQKRMSMDGSTFKMWKFRSMRVGAEEKTGAVWAKKDDDRRTPIGAFLRSTSLDELPQFWNVLVGEMSLVGPRPERPEFVSQFRGSVPRYMLRHKVKAGITGWAQINGWRGDTSLEKRIECDLYYIKNWSLWLDLKILFLTVFRGFINKNAY
jgi:Undecaprenyl-phosphate glucose phosphotransferase